MVKFKPSDREGVRRWICNPSQALAVAGDLNWHNATMISYWLAAHNAKGHPAKGALLTMPDNGQEFVYSGSKFWRYANKPRPDISYIWQSRCAICDAPYTFNKPAHSKSLVRTCPEHRGQWQAPKPIKPVIPRQGAKLDIKALVMTELDATSLISDSLDVETLLVKCAAQLPVSLKPGRDTRKQRCKAALQALHSAGKIKCNASGDCILL